MKCKSLTYNAEDNLKIHVFDDLFDFSERFHFYNFALNSRFLFKRFNSGLPEDKASPFQLTSTYSKEDLKYFSFFNHKLKKILNELSLENYYLHSSKVNACSSSDVYDYHLDSNQKTCYTVLYFLNMDWNTEWEGDTKFLDPISEEIFYSSVFKPGRLIIFSSIIPHKSSPASLKALHTRFSFNCVLSKESYNNAIQINDLDK